MAGAIAEILTDLAEALRGSGAFRAVTIGPDQDAARWPRAEVLMASTSEERPDDLPDGRWIRLSAKVCIHVRSSGQADATVRALELAESAQQSLLADRFRGQRCLDLPVGRATEIGPARPEPLVRAPYAAVSFEVRCHFELEGGS